MDNANEGHEKKLNASASNAFYCVLLSSGRHRCLQQMEVDGMSVDDVFSQCVFKKDEREMVLRAVQMVKPEYQPLVSKDQPVCSLPLVEQFYAEVLFYFCLIFYSTINYI